MPLVEGEGTLKVTASFGVASLATADAASNERTGGRGGRRAVRSEAPGKNRTVRSSTSSPARSAFTASLPGRSLSGPGMGLLDDAIREHLELKRSRGADPGEVERQEREALGAAPQAEFASTGEPEVAEPAPAEEPGAKRPVEPVDEVEPAEAPEDHEPFDVEALEPPAPAAPPEPDPWLEEERDEVPAGESLAHPREDAEEPAEDVLEDTPDFLQETPGARPAVVRAAPAARLRLGQVGARHPSRGPEAASEPPPGGRFMWRGRRARPHGQRR